MSTMSELAGTSSIRSLPQTLSPPPASRAPVAAPRPWTVIEPPRGWQWLELRELWRYRELLYFLAWRDVKIRYKQTILGAAWAVIQPFMMMVVFTVFLGGMAGVDSGGVPYPVFVYAGLLPWTFFATAISSAGNSVVQAQQIVTKVYFPRLAIPFASVGAAVVDFAIAFGMLLMLMAYYGVRPGWSIGLVVPLLLLTAVAALGVGTLLAALNVSFRDFKYTIPFLVQLWMFATPTVYMQVHTQAPSAARGTSPAGASAAAPAMRQTAPLGHAGEDSGPAAPENARRLPAGFEPLLHINPMIGVIAFFRAAVLGGPLPWSQLAYPVFVIAGLSCVGLAYFRRVESRFADII